MKKYILPLFLLIFICIKSFGQGNPCPPFSECWCEQHPEACDHNPPDTPIDGGISTFFVAGTVYGYYKIKKRKVLMKKKSLH